MLLTNLISYATIEYYRYLTVFDFLFLLGKSQKAPLLTNFISYTTIKYYRYILRTDKLLQLERWIHNPKVVGATPTEGSILLIIKQIN